VLLEGVEVEVVPDEFLCPITLELMTDPVLAEDGHTYERSAITDWFAKGNGLSPKTITPMGRVITPNHSLKAVIAGMVERMEAKRLRSKGAMCTEKTVTTNEADVATILREGVGRLCDIVDGGGTTSDPFSRAIEEEKDFRYIATDATGGTRVDRGGAGGNEHSDIHGMQGTGIGRKEAHADRGREWTANSGGQSGERHASESGTENSIDSTKAVSSTTDLPIRDWLVGTNPILGSYAVAFSNYGYETTSILGAAELTDLLEAFEDIKVKKPHRRLVITAFDALRSGAS
jgi:hypothetical protein